MLGLIKMFHQDGCIEKCIVHWFVRLSNTSHQFGTHNSSHNISTMKLNKFSDVSPAQCVWRMAKSTIKCQWRTCSLERELGLQLFETRRRDLVVLHAPWGNTEDRTALTSFIGSLSSYLHPTVEQADYWPDVTTALFNEQHRDQPANSLQL